MTVCAERGGGSRTCGAPVRAWRACERGVCGREAESRERRERRGRGDTSTRERRETSSRAHDTRIHGVTDGTGDGESKDETLSRECPRGVVATAAAAQETKKCIIITGSEKPHHALPRCCCGGSRSLADICARDGPASYRLRIFISHTASPKSTFSTTRSHPYAYCEHRALYGLNQRVLLDTQRLYDNRTGFTSSEHNT